MIIKGCTGNCLQGRRQCDCDVNEDASVSIILFVIVGIMFAFGLIFLYA